MGDQPDPVNSRRRNHRNRKRKGRADGAEDSPGARRPPGPGPARPAPGRVKQLVEELELDKCDFLEQPGRREQVEKLIGEFHDIFTTETKKVGMVPDRYRTTIKLKPGTVPIKQKLRPDHPLLQPLVQLDLQVCLLLGMHRSQLLLDRHRPWLQLDCRSVSVRDHADLLRLRGEDVMELSDELLHLLPTPRLLQKVALVQLQLFDQLLHSSWGWSSRTGSRWTSSSW